MVLETELDVKNKVNEARRLSRQLNYKVMQQRSTLSAQDYQQTIRNLTQQTNQLRSQINLATQQMSRLPRYRGMIATTMAQEQFAELNMYRNQLQMELVQETAWLNQLKSQPFDPKSKEKIDAEVRDERETYHQAILDLRKLVDSASEKYSELEKNDDVKKAAAVLGKGKREKPKLGPSHDFVNNVKLLEKLERSDSGDLAEEPRAKSGAGQSPERARSGP